MCKSRFGDGVVACQKSNKKKYICLRLIFLAAILVSIYGSIPLILSLTAAKKLHDNMLLHVLRAPVVTFFQTTPVGRILVRFTRDVDVITMILPVQLKACIRWVTEV